MRHESLIYRNVASRERWRQNALVAATRSPLCNTKTPVQHDSFIYMERAWFICAIFLNYMYDIAISGRECWRRNALAAATWKPLSNMTHSYIWGLTHYMWVCLRQPLENPCATWLTHIYGAWLFHIFDMSHVYVRHDSFIFVTWLIQICDETHWCMRHESLIYRKCCKSRMLASKCAYGSHLKPPVQHSVASQQMLQVKNVPRVEWRGLKIGGGNVIHRKVVFCIFRCQSMWVGISGDNLSSRIFWRSYKFQKTKWQNWSCGKCTIYCA